MIDHSPLFLGKSDVYARSRNDFAPEAIAWMAEVTGYGPGKTALDVGAGTGMLTKHLVALGGEVIALDPNEDMLMPLRDRFPQIHASLARAEDTKMPDECVDLVACARSFHWLDEAAAIKEFRRILRPPGWLVLMWTPRVTNDHPAWKVMAEVMDQAKKTYKQAVPWGREHRVHYPELFGGQHEVRLFPQEWDMDEERFVGLAESRSYFPLPGQPRYEEMTETLRQAFREHVPTGHITVPFETEIHIAHLHAAG
jgi:ubiquinone/menaquinone biosynthesis C-methylase UbiE